MDAENNIHIKARATPKKSTTMAEKNESGEDFKTEKTPAIPPGILRKRLITKMIGEYSTMFQSEASKYANNQEDREDIIQEFLIAKILSASIKQLETYDEKGIKYMRITLRNFIKDDLKRKKKQTQELNEYRIFMERNPKEPETDVVDEEYQKKREVLVICKNNMAKKPEKNRIRLQVFDLMIKGFDDHEIARQVKKDRPYVAVMKCRLKQYVREEYIKYQHAH